MKVLKFGGTSMGNATRMRSVAEILNREPSYVVVCSAMAGVTDVLHGISMAWEQQKSSGMYEMIKSLRLFFEKEATGLFSDQNRLKVAQNFLADRFWTIWDRMGQPWSADGSAWLVAQGELITCALFVQLLQENGSRALLLDALRLIRLNEMGEPDVADIRVKISSAYENLDEGCYVVQGYICRDNLGKITNLRRGGSDYTATLLGAALNASCIEVWTDVDGVRNNDPRHVPHTKPLRTMSYDEAAEMAYFGAKILHPSCVWPASLHEIPLYLKNTLDPSNPGTCIGPAVGAEGPRAVSAKDGITVIRIRSARMLNAYGFLHKVFGVFSTHKTPIDVITTSEVAVSLTIDNTLHLPAICRELEVLGEVECEPDCTIVCIVGDMLAGKWTARIMKAMQPFHLRMISLGGSRNNISMVLPSNEKVAALQALHGHLFQPSPEMIAIS